MIEVELRGYSKMDEENWPCATLRFPASQAEINRAFNEAGISGPEDCHVSAAETGLMFLDNRLDQMDYAKNAINELNYFAALLTGLDAVERETLNGMVVLEKPQTMKDLVNLAANLDGIQYAPEVKSAKQLGKFLVENGFFEVDPDRWKYLNYDKIGQERLQDENCCLTVNGYIEDGRLPEEIKAVYDGVNLPEDTPERKLLDFLDSESFAETLSERKNEYVQQGLEVPDDDTIRKSVLSGYLEQAIKEEQCRAEGHQWMETNLDPENGANDLECQNCGMSDHIQWM